MLVGVIEEHRPNSSTSTLTHPAFFRKAGFQALCLGLVTPAHDVQGVTVEASLTISLEERHPLGLGNELRLVNGLLYAG